MAEKLSRKAFDIRLKELKQEQQLYKGVWKDLRDYIAPYRGDFDEDSGKKGQRMDLKIYNGTGSMASSILSAGMNANITSPARTWFRLRPSETELMRVLSVRSYLQQVETVLYQIFANSNFYDMATLLYKEISVFGTACMMVVKDFMDVARFYTYTIGEYYLGTDSRGVVDTVYRRFRKTVNQLVQEFGRENVSRHVLFMYERNMVDQWVNVIHATELNDNRLTGKIDKLNKKYRSVYYEEDTAEDKFLRISGFDEFPYTCPKWSAKANEVYGTDQPGLAALGDIKELQKARHMKAEGIDRNVKPPLQAPITLKNTKIMNVPGGVTYFDPIAGSAQGIKSVYDTKVPLTDIIQDMQETENRINNFFYVDLFLGILSNKRPQDMKAEVAFQIDREKVIMLGPVLERLNKDWLDPLIDKVFNIAQDADIIPEPPAELQGQNLKAEYVSTLAKAQKVSAISNMERISALAGSWSQFDSGVIDKLDYDRGIDEAGELLDIPVSFIRSDDEVAEVREGRKQAQAQREALEASKAVAETAKDLAKAPVGTGNVLEQLTGTS